MILALFSFIQIQDLEAQLERGSEQSAEQHESEKNSLIKEKEDLLKRIEEYDDKYCTLESQCK